MMKPNSKQFKCTYKDAEVPVLVPVEYQMMKEIGCSRSDLHKIAIREMHNRRQHSTLYFIWFLIRHHLNIKQSMIGSQALHENKKEGTDLFIVGMWYLVMGWEVEKQ